MASSSYPGLTPPWNGINLPRIIHSLQLSCTNGLPAESQPSLRLLFCVQRTVLACFVSCLLLLCVLWRQRLSPWKCSGTLLCTTFCSHHLNQKRLYVRKLPRNLLHSSQEISFIQTLFLHFYYVSSLFICLTFKKHKLSFFYGRRM